MAQLKQQRDGSTSQETDAAANTMVHSNGFGAQNF
jgi:hypothetical protein